MSWLTRLTEFVKIDIHNIHVHDLINININKNDSSKRFEHNEGAKTLSINIDQLNDAEKEELRQIVIESVNEDVTLLEQESEELIEDIKLKEQSEDVQSLLGYFRDKIPPTDFAALRSAVYIKKLFEAGTSSQDIYQLKGEVIKKYGKRGLNICNLCSSGYFDTTIKSLREEIIQQGYDEEDFLQIYEIIINEEAFAIFVSGDMSNTEVKTAIERKINRNLKYGVKNLAIHGIGKNNAIKIREAVSDIEGNYPNIKKRIEEKGNIILVKLDFD